LGIAAAVATVGFWTYQLIWSTSQPMPPNTNESSPAQQSAPATTKEATSVQQTTTANAKETASIQQPVPTNTSEPPAQQAASSTSPNANANAAALSQSASTASFERRYNMEGYGPMIDFHKVDSVEECEQKCALSTECKVFSFDNSFQFQFDRN